MRLPDISALRFGAPEDERELHDARRLHGERYLEEGHVAALSPDGYVEDAYVDHSEYFVAVDQTDRVVGVARLIHGPAGALPSLSRFELHPDAAAALRWLPGGIVAEVSALATAKDAGRELFSASLGLYRAMLRSSWRAGVVWWVANWERPLHQLISRLLGVEFQVIGPPRSYMGAPTYPVALHLPTEVERLAVEAPEVWEFFAGGLGPHPHAPSVPRAA